jgi:hypothetical protein
MYLPVHVTILTGTTIYVLAIARDHPYITGTTIYVLTSARDRVESPGAGCTRHVAHCSRLGVSIITGVLSNCSTCDGSSRHDSVGYTRIFATVGLCGNTCLILVVFQDFLTMNACILLSQYVFKLAYITSNLVVCVALYC